MEQRKLLSAIIDIMAANHNALINSPKVQGLAEQCLEPHEYAG